MRRAALLRPLFLPLLLLPLLLAGAWAGLAAAKEVPFLTGHVNDPAGLLSDECRDRLEARLASFEDSAGTQFVILVETSLEGEPLEDYTLRVAEAWKLGREEEDDGLLFFVASEDRKMRFEVGHGLEGILNDGRCGRILDDYVVPRFRAGDFDGGVEGGVDAVLATLHGDPDLPPPPSASGGHGGREKPDLGFILGFMGIFCVVVGTFSLLAVVLPQPVTFLYFFLMPFYLLFPMAAFGPTGGFVALGFWVLAYPILRTFIHGKPFTKGRKPRWDWIRKMQSSSGGSRSSGWSSRSGWSGWSGGSGGSSSGSSFSGGGGSFGGGGASRSW